MATMYAKDRVDTMKIILEYDPVTKETVATEKDVTKEFAYAACAYYLATRIGNDTGDREKALSMVRGTCEVISELVKEKYKEKQEERRRGEK